MDRIQWNNSQLIDLDFVDDIAAILHDTNGNRASNKLREKLKSHYLFLCLIAMKVVQKRTNCRIGNGAEAFGNLSTIWKSSTISTSLKNKLVQLIGTFHCIMYGSETWQFFQKKERKSYK